MVELGALIKQARTVRCGGADYPVLSMTMHDGLVFQDDKFKKVIASKDRSDYKVVLRNQLVVSFPIDEGVLAAQRITDAGIVSPAYGIWDIDQKLIIPEFLEYALRCDRALGYYKAKLRGSTARRRSLPTPTLLAFTVPLPNVEEQRKILEIVKKVKDVIAARRQQLFAIDALIKARFVEMFGDPVSNPNGWKTFGLLELGSCKNGMNFHIDDSGVEVHCLGVGDFKNKSIINDASKLPLVSLNEKPSEDYLLQDDDIVFVRSNGNKELVGRCLVIFPGQIETTFSGFCIRFRKSSNEITTDYLVHVLKTESMRKKMQGRGANIQNLNQQILGTLSIPIPPADLQNGFSEFIAQVDKSKVAIQKSLDETQLLFDSLMQKYFG